MLEEEGGAEGSQLEGVLSSPSKFFGYCEAWGQTILPTLDVGRTSVPQNTGALHFNAAPSRHAKYAAMVWTCNPNTQ